jgi:hypothetical protein
MQQYNWQVPPSAPSAPSGAMGGMGAMGAMGGMGGMGMHDSLMQQQQPYGIEMALHHLQQRVNMLEQMVALQNRTNDALMRLSQLSPSAAAQAVLQQAPMQQQQQQQQQEGNMYEDGDVHVIIVDGSPAAEHGGEFRNCRRAAA